MKRREDRRRKRVGKDNVWTKKESKQGHICSFDRGIFVFAERQPLTGGHLNYGLQLKYLYSGVVRFLNAYRILYIKLKKDYIYIYID